MSGGVRRMSLLLRAGDRRTRDAVAVRAPRRSGCAARRLLAVAAVLALLTGSAASAQHTPPRAPLSALEHYEAGRAALKAERVAEAIEYLRQAVALRPDEESFALALAGAYERGGRARDARALLENLCAAHPQSIEAVQALAGVLLRDGAGQAAAKLLMPREAELTSAGAALLVDALQRAGRPADAALAARRAVERFPREEQVWLALVDNALSQQRAAGAVAAISEARGHGLDTPALALRAARAYLALGQPLGNSAVREVPGGRSGEIRSGWLLVEPRGAGDRFLCCPRESALFEVRRAIDGGADDPEVHCLHARVYVAAKMPKRGLALLREREALLLAAPTAEVARVFLDSALAADEIELAVRYALRAADADPMQRTEILHRAYLQVAERYNQRGDEALFAEFLRRAADLRPDDVPLALRLAEVEWSADRRSAAVRIYARLVRDHPGLAGDAKILERLADAPPAVADEP